MDNDTREKAKALIKVMHDGYYARELCLEDIVTGTQYKALEAALKPSKEEVADYWEERIGKFDNKGNEDCEWINQAIEYLRE